MDVVGQTVTGPQLDLTAWSSGLDINTLSRVGNPIADYLGGPLCLWPVVLLPDCVRVVCAFLTKTHPVDWLLW